MAFGMFSGQASPIAIDFGSSSAKMLQISSTGGQPALVAAAEITLPEHARGDADKTAAFWSDAIPKALKAGSFRGKRAVIAIHSSQTLISHLQLAETDGLSRDSAIKAHLQANMNVLPQNVVVRSVEVCPVHRNGQARTEIICFAIAKDTVMRTIELLKRSKLEVVGVHTEMLAMLRAFDHITRRAEDVNITTLYADMGWSGTRVAIAHGKQLVFARYINIGGKHFDQMIASSLKCDMGEAQRKRLGLPGEFLVSEHSHANAMMAVAAEAATRANAVRTNMAAAVMDDRRGSGKVPPVLRHGIRPADAPRNVSTADITELLDTITDELQMCLRYHQGLFRGRTIDRAIFVGGESRQAWLCQHVVKALRVQAQMADPLARFDPTNVHEPPGLTLGRPQPGWAVVSGLSDAPTEL
jgi:Tfp pilus assembly PilM family ATPase